MNPYRMEKDMEAVEAGVQGEIAESMGCSHKPHRVIVVEPPVWECIACGEILLREEKYWSFRRALEELRLATL